ncbi:MAG: hypothetical protein J0H68_09835 [Sphingobacteriia bacterium]|nr:hypothetical protein [Sphingobacteriia bacterium]
MLAKYLPFINDTKRVEHFKYTDQIPLLEILEDGKTIITKGGNLIQVIYLTGIDYTCLTEEQIEEYFHLRHSFFKKLEVDNENNISYAFHTSRRKIEKLTLTCKSENVYLKEIIKSSEENLKNIYDLMDFVVISVKLPARLANTNNYEIELNKSIKELNTKVEEFKSFFNYLYPINLTIDSGLITFWRDYVNGSTNPQKWDKKEKKFLDLNYELGLSNVTIEPKTGLVEFYNLTTEKNIYCKFLVIKELAPELHSWFFSKLTNIKFEYNIYQVIQPLSTEKTLRKVNRATGLVRAFFSFLRARLMELEELGERISTKDVEGMQHALVLRVKANSEAELDKLCINIKSLFSQSDIKFITETVGVYSTFFGVYPDYYNLLFSSRGRNVTTENVSAFINFNGSNHGLTKSPFGDEPVTIFKTLNGSYYNFTFHESEKEDSPGHCVIIGGTGKGKTTLITYLLLNSLKFDNLKILSFDSLKGTKIATDVFGGAYIDPLLEKIRLNPCLLPDSKENRAFLESFFASLIGEVDEEEKRAIRNSVDVLYRFPKDKRLLSTIEHTFVSLSEKKLPMKERLAKWLPKKGNEFKDDIYSSLFSNTHDELEFNKNIVCFDMNGVLNEPKIVDPLTTYILHAFDNYVKNNLCPHICFIDEFHKYVEQPLFKDFITTFVRESRKRKGLLIAATQDVETLSNTEAGSVLINNHTTGIFFPNPSAEKFRNSYIKDFRLNESELNWIVNCKEQHQVLIKKVNQGSVIVDVNLSHLGKLRKLLSSNSQDVEKASLFKQTNPEDWVEKYLEP